ncbi:NAD-dependent epimerase/dehydratase family protein [Nakamurella lactea]|uniref:NAD-dependent epimerase/dehydratase family protein n=1 Tax=Nakamurella lactea TaxID=459515 RepID=UPI00055BB87E|nr:NAD-dependent epimerase/dehydratase family protein [Nakamurella lactea]
MANMLILGGTGWLSREVAAQAVTAGHQVTCLARGSTEPAAGARLVIGDRDVPGAYDDVADDRWDVVVDVSRQPGQVRSAATALRASLGDHGHWVFVSTGSVYLPDADRLVGTEDDPVRPALEVDEAGIETYGEGKVACELALDEILGDRRVTVARAGLIGGPGDGSDRFGYWPTAFARAAADGQGPVLVPDVPELSTQVIDVRDLATWLLHAGLTGTAGVFDTVGTPTTVGAVLRLCREIAGHTGDVIGRDPEWLTAQEVGYWSGPKSLPLWLPADHELAVPRTGDKATAAGLVRRPMTELVADVLADEIARGLDRDRGAGLTRATELELIDVSS